MQKIFVSAKVIFNAENGTLLAYFSCESTPGLIASYCLSQNRLNRPIWTSICDSQYSHPCAPPWLSFKYIQLQLHLSRSDLARNDDSYSCCHRTTFPDVLNADLTSNDFLTVRARGRFDTADEALTVYDTLIARYFTCRGASRSAGKGHRWFSNQIAHPCIAYLYMRARDSNAQTSNIHITINLIRFEIKK